MYSSNVTDRQTSRHKVLFGVVNRYSLFNQRNDSKALQDTLSAKKLGVKLYRYGIDKVERSVWARILEDGVKN